MIKDFITLHFALGFDDGIQIDQLFRRKAVWYAQVGQSTGGTLDFLRRYAQVFVGFRVGHSGRFN